MWKHFHFIKKLPENLIFAFENENIPLSSYWITFLFILELRFFIESFSTTSNYFNESTYYFLFDLIHYNLSFITLALMLMTLFFYATKTSIAHSARIVLPSFMLLLIAPLFDLIITQGKGTDIYYMGPWVDINIILTYLTYFNLGGFEGASTGIKYEALIALFACFIYFRNKKCSFFKSLLFTWLCYTCIFIWASSPYLIQWFLKIIQFDMDLANHCDSIIMTHFYLIILLFLSIIVFYLANKKLLLTYIKNTQWFVWLNYELILIFGVTLALTKANTSLTVQLFVQPHFILNTVFCMISLVFSGLFSISMNKVSKENINHQSINLNNDKTFGFIALAIAFFYSAIVSVKVLLIISFINANSYIYAMPPIQFKRFLFFSKLIFSLNSLASLILGYLIVFDHIYLFPHELFWIILIGYTGLGSFYSILAKKRTFRDSPELKENLQPNNNSLQ